MFTSYNWSLGVQNRLQSWTIIVESNGRMMGCVWCVVLVLTEPSKVDYIVTCE